jgi:hypothetical protein
MPNLYDRVQANKQNESDDDGEKAPRNRPAPAKPFIFEGAYDVFGDDGKTVIGSDTWKLHATAHGISGTGLIKLESPSPQVRHVRLSLGHKWEWQNLSVRIENGPQIMMGFENGKVNGHFKGATGLRNIDEVWKPWYEIDFHSTLFTTIISARLSLATGESERTKVYLLDKDALLPTWTDHIYTRAEHVPSPAFPRQPLIHYTLDFGATGERILHYWVDQQPVVWHFRNRFKLRTS